MIPKRTERGPWTFEVCTELLALLHERWALRLAAAIRRHQSALLAATIALGILLMIIHWSGSLQDDRARAGLAGPAPDADFRESAARHRESHGPPAPERTPVADTAPSLMR